jgi:SAM-dependent methyltransferase
MSSVVSARRAYEAALGGADCYLVGMSSRPTRLPTARWRAPATHSDRRLLAWCDGATLDVGCGPGRMTAALLGRGHPALGIDVSEVAVMQARERGVPALVRDVFGPVPAVRRWDSVLLADGNVGIGGNPERLLRRAGQLLRTGGFVVADVAPPGVRTRAYQLALMVDHARTAPFSWAVVGVDDVEHLASSNGFAVDRLTQAGGRWTVRLCNRGGRQVWI